MAMLESVRSIIGSDAYIGAMPDTPDAAVAIYATGGFNRRLAGDQVREPTFMVRVRNPSYAAGYARCVEIANALHGVNNTPAFLLIAQMGDIQDLGRDQSNRAEFTLNFRAFIKG